MISRVSLEKYLGEAVSFLERIMAVPALSGQEEDLMRRLQAEFALLCDSAQLLEMPADLPQDPLYCSVVQGLSYRGRHNLRLTLRGRGADTLILNAHADIVPAPEALMKPRISDGVITGRGACDDKGQIAAIYLLLLTLKNEGIIPEKTIEVHLVCEEEIGGNGTLGLMRREMSASLAVVMEPTGLKLFTAARGAVWFTAVLKGVAGHSGETKTVKNALLDAVALMGVLEGYHKDLYAALIGAHPFEKFENPMPLTFGKLHAGDWPATAPGEAVLEGVCGFLPGITAAQLIQEINARAKNAGLACKVVMKYPFMRDPVVMDEALPCIKAFGRAIEVAGIPLEYSALPACCDAWFYAHEKNIPTVIFGAGDLKDAHSEHEKIALKDIASCAHALMLYVCGL